MTLTEAKKAILENGQFVTRDAWIKQSPGPEEDITEVETVKVLMKHGGYAKPTEDLYTRKLKETAEFFKITAIEFQPHIDCLEITNGDVAKLHVGWTPTEEDVWATDYTEVSFDNSTPGLILNVDAIPQATPEEAMAKLTEVPIEAAELTAKIEAKIESGDLVVDNDTVILEDQHGIQTTVDVSKARKRAEVIEPKNPPYTGPQVA